MKKLLCAILCVMLCAALCFGSWGCKTTGEGGKAAADPMVIIDNEYIKQTVVSADFNYDGDYVLGTTVENKTDRSLTVDWRICTVNGVVFMVREQLEVQPKSSGVLELEYYDWYLEEVGITEVDELGFYVMVSDTEERWSGDPLYTGVCYHYPDGKSPDEATRFVRQSKESDIVVEDSEDATFIVDSMEFDSFGNWNVNCYFVNNTDEPMIYEVKTLTADGWLLDPYGTLAYLLPHSCCLQSIEVNKQLFEKSGITTPTELRFVIDKSDVLANDDYFGATETFTVYNSTDGLVAVTSPERTPVAGEVTLVDNEYFTMIVEGYGEGALSGTSFACYFENNSDKEITINVDEVTIDGKIYNTFAYVTLEPGIKTWTTADVNDLEDCTGVEKFVFRIRATDDEYNELMHELVTYQP